jgi:hypothetical protein
VDRRVGWRTGAVDRRVGWRIGAVDLALNGPVYRCCESFYTMY